MSDSDEYAADDWGSSGGDDDGRSQTEIDIENNFYEGEGCVKDDPSKALEMFETVIDLEKDRDDCNFGFKAIT
jgi:hypothetical protein